MPQSPLLLKSDELTMKSDGVKSVRGSLTDQENLYVYDLMKKTNVGESVVQPPAFSPLFEALEMDS